MGNIPENEMANTDVEAVELIENKLVEALGVLSERVLPVTSTINDNAQLMDVIKDMSKDLKQTRYKVRFGHYSSNADWNKLFGIDHNSSFSIYNAPEAVGEFIISELGELIRKIVKENDPCFGYSFIPEDDILDARESRVSEYFKLDLHRKEVDRWFYDFFGPKTRTIRTRWQRLLFVVYLEKEMESSGTASKV
jgi:hypothetical protein